jgi:sugar lactone lactonase YvrE
VGTGIGGFSGDNGPAIDAQIGTPQGIGVDAAGNLYIADTFNFRVRKVSNGIITTIAGNGTAIYSGDGSPATSTGFFPRGLAVSPAGDVYVSESSNGVAAVRKISNGTIVTVAGTGKSGFSNAEGSATQIPLGNPSGLALDQAGNLYIADMNGLIRKISNGMMTTLAGTLGAAPGTSAGDGGAATNAQLNSPNIIAVDPLGRLYIGEGLFTNKNAHVRRVSNGIITTVAGNGAFAYSGDGGPATGASLSPLGLAIGPNGQVYEADFLPSRVRVLTPVPISGVSFSANPNAVPTNAGSTVGQTTLSWNAPGYTSLQIFANGSLFADVGSSGSVATGNWVSDGMNFSLVDPATGAPLSTVTVHTTAASSGGQISFAANPNPIALAAGTSVGKTTLSWNAPGNSALQIWVSGVLFAAALPASGTIETGNWVSDGLPFSLIDPATGQTIASVTIATK